MDGFIEFLIAVFTLPFDLMRNENVAGGPTAGDWALGIVAFVIIYGITAAVIWWTLRGVWRKYIYFATRQRCQHCQGWTVDNSHFDGYPSVCHFGAACCSSHLLEHLRDTEPKLMCPACGSTMVKTIAERVVLLDECPNGHGIWLSDHEHRQLLDRSYRKGRDDGSSSGTMNGYALGIATGIAIN